jgi:glucosamine-6-phosphate deaminase
METIRVVDAATVPAGLEGEQQAREAASGGAATRAAVDAADARPAVQLIVVDDYQALSRVGADIVARAITQQPSANLLVATGRTPMGVYRELAARTQRGKLGTSRLRIFQLDAYLGLRADDRRSLYRWMKEAFLDPLGIPEANVVRLHGDAPDPAAVCRAYDAAVREAGGIDLSVLGLGPNGHLGFNEPGTEPAAPTRVVDLTEASVESSAVYWGGRDSVPRKALTAGMGVLLAARQTLLLVSGTQKQEILHRTLEGPISPDVPASLLRRAQGVTVLADRAAWPWGAQSQRPL